MEQINQKLDIATTPDLALPGAHVLGSGVPRLAFVLPIWTKKVATDVMRRLREMHVRMEVCLAISIVGMFFVRQPPSLAAAFNPYLLATFTSNASERPFGMSVYRRTSVHPFSSIVQ